MYLPIYLDTVIFYKCLLLLLFLYFDFKLKLNYSDGTDFSIMLNIIILKINVLFKNRTFLNFKDF